MQTTILVSLLHALLYGRKTHTHFGVKKKTKYKGKSIWKSFAQTKGKSLSAKCSSYYDYFVFSFRIFTILCL